MSQRSKVGGSDKTVGNPPFPQHSVTFLSNGCIAFACGTIINVWDFMASVRQWELCGDNGIVTCIRLTPNGKQIVSGSTALVGGEENLGHINMWEVDNGKLVRTIKCDASSIDLSLDGRRIVTGSGASICVWDVDSGKCLQTIERETSVRTVRFAPGGQHVLCDGNLHNIHMLDLASGQLQKQFDHLSCEAFEVHEHWLITRDCERLKVWDQESGRLVHDIKTSSFNKLAVGCSREEAKIAKRKKTEDFVRQQVEEAVRKHYDAEPRKLAQAKIAEGERKKIEEFVRLQVNEAVRKHFDEETKETAQVKIAEAEQKKREDIERQQAEETVRKRHDDEMIKRQAQLAADMCPLRALDKINQLLANCQHVGAQSVYKLAHHVVHKLQLLDDASKAANIGHMHAVVDAALVASDLDCVRLFAECTRLNATIQTSCMVGKDVTTIETRNLTREALIQALLKRQGQRQQWLELSDQRNRLPISFSVASDNSGQTGSDAVQGNQTYAEALFECWQSIAQQLFDLYSSSVQTFTALDKQCQSWQSSSTLYDLLLLAPSIDEMASIARQHHQLKLHLEKETNELRTQIEALDQNVDIYCAQVGHSLMAPVSVQSRQIAFKQLHEVRNQLHSLLENDEIVKRIQKAKRKSTAARSQIEQAQQDLERTKLDIKYEKDAVRRQKLEEKVVKLAKSIKDMHTPVHQTHELLRSHADMLMHDYPEVLVDDVKDLCFGSAAFDDTVSFQDYVILDVLRPDKVFVAENKTHEKCVIKKIVGIREFRKECERLYALRHPFIVPVNRVFPDLYDRENVCFLEMPYYEAGNLRQWVTQMQAHVKENLCLDARTAFRDVRRVFVEIVQALMHIHSKGVVHCDLKPENVLVSDSGRIALCDFGISSDVGPNNSNVTTTMIAGTPGYMAPYADWKRNPTALDVWSLGCMMLELLLPVFAEIPGVIPTRQRLATYLTVGEVPIQDIDWIKLVDFFSAPHMNAYARLCSQLLVPDVMDALSVHEVLLTDVFVAVDTTQSTGLETRWQTVLTAISRVRKANKTPVVLSVTSSLSSMDPSHANADVFCTEVVEKLTTSVSDLRILLRIVDGQGALVPLNEVVELFFRRVVLPQYGLFTQSFEGTLNGDAKTKQEEPVHSQESQRAFVPAVHAKRTHPEAVGKLIAKCVIERVRVPLVLNSATLEFMLGRPERRTSLDDALDILRETCDDEMYMLFHSVARQLCVEQRQLRVCDLDGSSNVEPVTSANKVRVLQDAIWHKLVHQRHASLESLRRGFRCGGLEHVLESVSGKELQDLFFGNDFIDLRDIRQSICFTDANWTDKAAMNAMRTWLLQWLTNANEMTRRVFLIRCVSTCALRKVPTIYVVQSDDDLVHVASGSQSLYLPVVGDTDLPEFEKHFRAQLLLEYVDETVCTKCHSTIASQDERVHCEYSHINCTTCVLHKVMSVVDGTAVVRRAQDLALVCGKLGCSSKLNDGQVVRVVPEHDMTTFRQLFREMAPCCICLTDEPRCIGTTCYQGHFVCYEMLEGKLKSELIQIANNETLINAERLVSNKGLVKCPSVDCPERWNIGVLLPRLTLETRNQLLTCLVTYSRTEEEAQEERRATEARLVRLRAEEDMRLDERVHGLRQHIVEELLHSKCPHCRALFVDYNACDALHCASDQNAAYGCKRSFCAICLQPFADSDATHTHVRSAHGIYFGGNRFQEASRDRKTRLVRDFLATIGDQNVLRCVREAIRLDLRDIGIVIGE